MLSKQSKTIYSYDLMLSKQSKRPIVGFNAF